MRPTDLLAAGFLALLAVPAFAQTTNTGIKLDNSQPIQIESDKLEVEDAKAMATFTGNVNVTQGETLLKAGKMVVYYVKKEEGGAAAKPAATTAPGASQDIDRILVSDKVYVKSADQVATADAGEFNMKTSVMVLTGKEVILTQGGNVAKGCKLTVNTASGEAQLDGCGGRVQVQLPGSSGN